MPPREDEGEDEKWEIERDDGGAKLSVVVEAHDSSFEVRKRCGRGGD